MKQFDKATRENLRKLAEVLGFGDISEASLDLVGFILSEKESSYKEGYRDGLDFAQKVIKS